MVLGFWSEKVDVLFDELLEGRRAIAVPDSSRREDDAVSARRS